MKKVYTACLFACLLFLMGCSSKVYEEAMQNGHDAIEKEEYAEAEGFFQQALEKKKNDETAMTLLKQVQYFQLAQSRLDEGKLDPANDALEKVISTENGSDVLVERATTMQDEVKELKANAETVEESYKLAKEQFDNEKYNDAIKMIEETLEQDLSHPVFASVKQKFDSLLEVAQQNAEVQAAERKAAEQAEKERKEAEEKAKREAEKGIGNAAGYWLKDDKGEACHITSTYWACAVAYSDVMFHDQFASITHKSPTEIQVATKSGYSATIQMKGKDTLFIGGDTYHRVSEKQANAIYDGFYTLP